MKPAFSKLLIIPALAVVVLGLAAFGSPVATAAVEASGSRGCVTASPSTPERSLEIRQDAQSKPNPKHPVVQSETRCEWESSCSYVPMESVTLGPDGNPTTVIVWVQQCSGSWNCYEVWVPVAHHHPPPDNIF